MDKKEKGPKKVKNYKTFDKLWKNEPTEFHKFEIINGRLVTHIVDKHGNHLRSNKEEVLSKVYPDPSETLNASSGGGTAITTVVKPDPITLDSYEFPIKTYLRAYDQGLYDTCMSWALATALRTGYYKANGKIRDFSHQFIYGMKTDDGYEGMYFDELMSNLRWLGVPICQDLEAYALTLTDETLKKYVLSLAREQHAATITGEKAAIQAYADNYDYYHLKMSDVEPVLTSTVEAPYTAKQVAGAVWQAKSYSSLFNTSSYVWITSDEMTVKAALVKYASVIVTMQSVNVQYCCYLLPDAKLDKCHNGETGRKVGKVYTVDLDTGGHALTIVGWCKVGGTPCWKILNSWGVDNFGDGYIYIPFTLLPSVSTGMAAITLDNSNPTTFQFKKENWTTNGDDYSCWWMSSVNKQSEYASGKQIEAVLNCDVINSLTYYINKLRESKGLVDITLDWVTESNDVTATKFNELRNGYIGYKQACGQTTQLSTLLSTKATNDPVSGQELWTLYDTIENNL
jgi:hypothetical protein